MKQFGQTTTLSPVKQKAYAFKDQCAQHIMREAMANNIEPHNLVEPFAQLLASLVAASAATGHPIDVPALLKKFPDEVSEMTKVMLARVQ